MAIFNGYVTNYQRVRISSEVLPHLEPLRTSRHDKTATAEETVPHFLQEAVRRAPQRSYQTIKESGLIPSTSLSTTTMNNQELINITINNH